VEIISGLASSIVLQRDLRNVSQAGFAGTSEAEGPLQARVRKAGKVVRGWEWKEIGRCADGRFEGALEGIPTGGPYQVDLRIVSAACLSARYTGRCGSQNAYDILWTTLPTPRSPFLHLSCFSLLA
jgi:hypothetical protein